MILVRAALDVAPLPYTMLYPAAGQLPHSRAMGLFLLLESEKIEEPHALLTSAHLAFPTALPLHRSLTTCVSPTVAGGKCRWVLERLARNTDGLHTRCSSGCDVWP